MNLMFGVVSGWLFEKDWLSTVHLCKTVKAAHMPNSICENFIKIYFKFANINSLIYHCQQESTTLRISYLQILLKYISNLQISLSSLTAK